MKPKVSVIIPTYNEQAHITDCLASLKTQSYRPLEIILVDDGSTDNTIKLVKHQKGIRLIRQSHLGPGPARNKGSQKAKGQILVFVDADMTFDPHFINQLIKPILSHQALGTFTKEEYVANWDNQLARYWNYQSGIKTNRRLPDNFPNQAKVFRAILKSEFDRVGGFDPIGYTDDWSLSSKLKINSQAAPGAICYHHNPDSWADVWVQASWIGKRRYKLGLLGKLIALIRSSFPISFFIAIFQAVYFQQPGLFFFKLYYDLAIFIAICRLIITKKNVK